jgi:hypothetical protein
MKTAILAAFCVVLFVPSADVRLRHRHYEAPQVYLPECNVSMPCEGAGKPVVNAKEGHRLLRG